MDLGTSANSSTLRNILNTRKSIIAVLFAILVLTSGFNALLTQFSAEADIDAEVKEPAVTFQESQFVNTTWSDDQNPAGRTQIETYTLKNNVEKEVPVTISVSGNLSQDSDLKLAERITRTGSEQSYTNTCDHHNTQDNFSNITSDTTVCIEDGNYTGGIVLNESDVTLISENLHGAKIDTAENNSLSDGFIVNASNITIRGFNITGDDTTVAGITVNTGTEGEPGAYSNITLQQNRITGMKKAGGNINPALEVIDRTNTSKITSKLEEKLQEYDIIDTSTNISDLTFSKEDIDAVSYGIRVRGMRPAEKLEITGNQISEIGRERKKIPSDTEQGGLNISKYIEETSSPIGVGLAVQSINSTNEEKTEIKNNKIKDINGGIVLNENFIRNLKERIREEVSDDEWNEIESNIESMEEEYNIEDRLREENIDLREFRIGSGAIVVGTQLERDSINEPEPQRLEILRNEISNVDYGVSLANPNGTNVSQNNLEGTHIDIVEANVLSDKNVTASNNWFGTDGATYYGDVNSNWKEINDEQITLDLEENREIAVINKVPLTIGEGNYTSKIEVKPSN